MSRFHINPKTGNPGLCSANISCPFGDINADHYSSKEEARTAYEKKQANGSVAPLKKAPRGKNWALVRYSDITGETYLDDTFSTEAQLNKKLADLNRYDHHSAHYSGQRTSEAVKLVKAENLPSRLQELKREGEEVDRAERAKRGARQNAVAPSLGPTEKNSSSTNGISPKAFSALQSVDRAADEPLVPAQQAPSDSRPSAASQAGFFTPRNSFDSADIDRLIADPTYREIVRARYEEIVEEYHAERKDLDATEEGRRVLADRDSKELSKRLGRWEASQYHGRGFTYYYIAKTGGVRETHTNGSAAISRSRGYVTERGARAARDVIVTELQHSGMSKKEANTRLFEYSTHDLQRAEAAARRAG